MLVTFDALNDFQNFKNFILNLMKFTQILSNQIKLKFNLFCSFYQKMRKLHKI